MTLSNINQYGSHFQTKVISALLTDKKFLQNIFDVLSDEYFDSQGIKWIINEIVKYYEKFHCNITMDILKVELKKLDNEVLQLSIKEQLKEAYKASEEDLRYVEEEFSNFCKNQQLKKALLTSADLLKAGDYGTIETLMKNALKAGQSKDLGLVYEKDIEYRYREDDRNPNPFPWVTFNKLTKGGYGKGDLILIVGSPGGGKSWSLIAMAAENVKRGENVIFYSLELSENYVGKRFDSYFTGIDVSEIEKHRDKVEEVVSQLPGKLIIKGYPPKRASLRTIEQHAKQVIDENSTDEKQFVVSSIFIDYLDLTKTKLSRKEKKDELDDVYTEAKGMAVELKVPIISPSQANRAGADSEILEGKHIANSYDKLMIGDIVISLARGRADKLNGTGRWHIMKNRYGPDGMTFFSKINTSNGHIEIDEEEHDVENQPDTQSFGKKKQGDLLDSNEKDFLKRKFIELGN